MPFTAAFIGTGNMGAALARAAARTLPPNEIVLCDRFPEKARTLADTLGCSTVETPAAAAESRFLFLGAKPQMMGDLLAELREPLKARADAPPVLISMAAGLTLAQLGAMASGGRQPVIRIMPNTPVAVGAGVIVFAGNEHVSEEQKAEFSHFMAGAGTVQPLEESLMDAATAVSGCGPAFTYAFLDALADGGVACGLGREDALRFAAQTVLGAAETLLRSGKHPALLKNEVCSPGGSTIQGVRVLEQRALHAACMDAVIAAFEKNRDLGAASGG